MLRKEEFDKLHTENPEELNNEEGQELQLGQDEVIQNEGDDGAKPDDGEQKPEGDESSEEKPNPFALLRKKEKILRKKEKENAKKIQQLQKALEEKEEALRRASGIPPEPEFNPERPPQLFDDGIDGDQEVLSNKIIDWTKRKLELDNQEKAAKDEWQKTIDAYERNKQLLDDEDFDDYEESVKERFDRLQQNVILKAARNPANVVKALYFDTAAADNLQRVKDPIEFARAIFDLEQKISRKANSAPVEKPIRAATGSITNTDLKTLEDLRKEAEKTNDYTRLARFRMQMAAKSAKRG